MLDDSPGPAEQLENTKAASGEAAFLIWCPETESNRRHGDFQSPALPTELSGQRGAIKRLLPGHVKPLLCRWSFAGRHIAFRSQCWTIVLGRLSSLKTQKPLRVKRPF